MGEKLTKMQRERLEAISVERLSQFGAAAWWGGAADKSLLRRGLVERCDQTKRLSPAISFSTHLCRLTPAGRAALASQEPTNG